jgi:hypothetical protein
MLREIGRVASFLICARMLLHFRAKESYEKYIRLCISLILLLFLTQPFFRLVHGVKSSDITWLIQNYDIQMEEALSEMQPKEQDLETVLQALVERAASRVKQEQVTDYKENGTGSMIENGANTDIVEKVCIEQIEIGGE